MKFKIKKLHIENYKRFKNETITFPLNDLILISGKNLDFSGTDSNGAGKSTITSAISWATTGNTIENTNNLITRGENQCKVVIDYTNGLTIERVMKKTTQKIKLFKQKKNIVTKEISKKEILKDYTNTEKQKYIYELFGIDNDNQKFSYLSYINSSYFDPDGINIFLSTSIGQAEKLNFFAKHFRLQTWDEASKKAREKEQEIALSIRDLENKISSINDWLQENEYVIVEDEEMTLKEYLKQIKIYKDKLKKEIQDLEEQEKKLRPEESILQLIAKIESDIQHNLNEIEKYEYKIENTNEKIEGYNNNIYRSETLIKQTEDQISKLVSDIVGKNFAYQKDTSISEINDSLDSVNREIDRIARKIVELNNLLKETLVCPSCKAQLLLEDNKLVKYSVESKVSISKQVTVLEEKLKELYEKKKISEHYRSIHEYKINIKNLDEKLNQYKLLKEETEKNYDEYNQEIKNLKSKIKSLQKELSEKEKIINDESNEKWKRVKLKIEESKDNMEEILQEIGSSTETLNQIAEYKKEIKVNKRNLINLQEVQANLKYWITAFKKIKALVLENSFVKLNNLTNKNLELLNLPYTFDVKATKETKTTNSLKLALDINITDEFGNTGEIEEFSKGEKTRIVSAMMLALRELKPNNLGYIIFDEYLNLLDETGKDETLKLLQIENLQSFVITNSQSLINNWNGTSLVVTRKNGISTVKYPIKL